MYTRQTIVKNRSGLHARPASEFVAAAKKYQSKLTISRVGGDEDDGPANAKSIVMLLALGLGSGSTVEISANGADETEAVNALIELIDSGFGED